MLKKEDIDRFYEDVKELGLKFPVAAITEATGHSKSNVSKYLSRKLEPSESFLNAFYGKFPKGGKNVSRETNLKVDESQDPNKEAIRSLADSNKLIAESNRQLAESNKSLAASNAELITMVKGSVGVSQEKTLTVETILPGLQELLIDLGLGKLWKSKDEGSATLHRHLFGSLKEKKLKGIHESSDKLHR